MTLPAPSTVREALEQLAELDVISDVVKERREVLRGYLREQATQVEATTGAAANLHVKGVGRAYMTQPGERIRVIDEDAWGLWARSRYPERCLHRPRLPATRFWSWMAEHSIVEAEMREAGLISDEILPETGLEDEVAATAARLADGTLVDAETGEVLPLRVQPLSRPSLTVRIEAKYRDALIGRLQLPALEEADA